MSDDNFRDLLARARAGEREAMQQILQPYLPGLHGFVRLRIGGVIGQRESKDDVVQSVCCQAVAKFAELRAVTEAEFKQWLYAIALNKILDKADYHQAMRRSPRLEVPQKIESQVQEQDVLSVMAKMASPSQDAMGKEAIEKLEKAFQLLTDEQREVLLLTRIAGLTHAEIADKTGKTEAAVRKTLSRARARLAMILSEEDPS